LAARQMRHYLVDRTRRKRARKREGQNISLDDCLLIGEALDERLLALDTLLTELNKLDHEAASVVEMRYFSGYSEVRAAELLDISPADVRDHFEFAKAWLRERMTG
jgi:RNA polymerase sigma factor (TIGR02999 family)